LITGVASLNWSSHRGRVIIKDFRG
jgi:hypothetical protein